MKTKSAARTFCLHAMKAALANPTVLYAHGQRYKKDPTTPLSDDAKARLLKSTTALVADFENGLRSDQLVDLDA